MEKVVARLTGEIDGHSISQEFGDVPSAQAWLQGKGLDEFTDQLALGEVLSSDGKSIWRKSHLQTQEQADRDRSSSARWVLARMGFFNKHSPRWKK